jgi:hypothetical protein
MVKELFTVFAKLSFLFVVVYVIAAGFGQTVELLPSSDKKKCGTGGGWRTRNVKGNAWGTPVVQASLADDGLAFPAAPVM